MCAEGIADYCWMIGVDGLAGRHDVRCSHRNGACHAVHHVYMDRQTAPSCVLSSWYVAIDDAAGVAFSHRHHVSIQWCLLLHL